MSNAIELWMNRRASGGRRSAFRAAFLLSAAAFALPCVAHADQAQPASGDAAQAAAGEEQGGGGDIVVTANRRAESIQRVPAAVTALSPEAFSTKGLGSLADVTAAAPAVNFQQISPGVNRIDMRGITTGSIDVNATQDRPLVAVYLDDIPLALQSGNPDIRVFDLERIEVIRGPQGTLYGAGSMAGTIRYITAKPSLDGVSGSVEATGALTENGAPSYSVRGLVNVPLSSDLAVRIGVYQGRDGGYIDNIGTGQDNANYAQSTQARIAVRYTPVDRLTLDASYTYVHLKTGGLNPVFMSVLDRYTFDTNTAEGFTDNLHIYNFTGKYDLGGVDLISSSSYVDRNNIYREDYGFAGGFFGLPTLLRTNSSTTNTLRDFTQEVRLVSNGSGPLNFTVGAFYENVRRHNDQDIPSPGFDAAFSGIIGAPYNSLSDLANSNDDLFSGYQTIREHQFALFGEAKLTLGRLDITGGLRYFNFKQDYSIYNAGIAGTVAPGVPNQGSGTAKADGFNPRAVVSYRVTDDLMLYGEAAKGFRYGGVSPAVPQLPCGLSASASSFGPDSLWSYTIGEKAQLFDRRLTFNLAGFYVKWSNVQTTKLLACGYGIIQNAGQIESKGLELETRLKVTDALTFGVNASYTDATADGPIPNIGAADGDRVPYFPRYTVSASVDYAVPLGEGELALAADVQQRGKTYTEFSQANPLQREMPETTLVNVSASYTVDDWQFGIFGTNLTNNKNVTLIRPGRALEVDDRTYVGRPRTVGIRAKRTF